MNSGNTNSNIMKKESRNSNNINNVLIKDTKAPADLKRRHSALPYKKDPSVEQGIKVARTDAKEGSKNFLDKFNFSKLNIKKLDSPFLDFASKGGNLTLDTNPFRPPSEETQSLSAVLNPSLVSPSFRQPGDIVVNDNNNNINKEKEEEKEDYRRFRQSPNKDELDVIESPRTTKKKVASNSKSTIAFNFNKAKLELKDEIENYFDKEPKESLDSIQISQYNEWIEKNISRLTRLVSTTQLMKDRARQVAVFNQICNTTTPLNNPLNPSRRRLWKLLLQSKYIAEVYEELIEKEGSQLSLKLAILAQHFQETDKHGDGLRDFSILTLSALLDSFASSKIVTSIKVKRQEKPDGYDSYDEL